MPCYDSRDDEPAPFDHHNNPTAELLCSLMKHLEVSYTRGLMGEVAPQGSKLWHWWADHKERDRKKAEFDKRNRAAEAMRTAAEIKRLESKLVKLRKG